MHTSALTFTDARMHAHTHMRAHTPALVHINTHPNAQACAKVDICIHEMCVRRHPHASVFACAHACTVSVAVKRVGQGVSTRRAQA
eukprot:615340-Pleurochrysis_carterae.AAC.1